MEEYLGFQLKNLGDVLMTLPALALLKKHRPNCRISMALRPLTAPLLENHPLVDEVIVHRFKPRGLDLLHSYKLSRSIKKRGYSASFHFDGQLRGGLLAYLAGLPVRAVGLGLLGVSGLKCPRLYNRRIALRDKNSAWESLALSHQKLVAGVLGLEAEPDIEVPPLVIPKEAAVKAEALLDSLPGQGPVVGLTLSGRQKEKSWPLDFWAEVIKTLGTDNKARFYVAGEAGERPLADNLAGLGDTFLGNFCGLTDLLDFVALAGRSDLFLTVDTGSAHLVSLTSTPLVTIFTATNPVQWGALSPRQARLCYNWALARFGLTDGPFAGYPIVSPFEVIKAARSFLRPDT
jgi:ADP-heptose:LPS heptosyltransferase